MVILEQFIGENMPYNLVGQRTRDGDPFVIGTFPTEEEAKIAADEASESDQYDKWKFFIEPVKDNHNGFGWKPQLG